MWLICNATRQPCVAARNHHSHNCWQHFILPDPDLPADPSMCLPKPALLAPIGGLLNLLNPMVSGLFCSMLLRPGG